MEKRVVPVQRHMSNRKLIYAEKDLRITFFEDVTNVFGSISVWRGTRKD